MDMQNIASCSPCILSFSNFIKRRKLILYFLADQYFPINIDHGEKKVKITQRFEEYKGQPEGDWKDHNIEVKIPLMKRLRKKLKGERWDALGARHWSIAASFRQQLQQPPARTCRAWG